MSYQGRNQSTWRRKGKQRIPVEKWLILCEGETEFYYLKALIQLYRLNSVTVGIAEGSAPISIVEQAIKTARLEPGIDRIVCVFDRDKHESYDRAINKLENHQPRSNDKSKPRYQVIRSIPCFEIWLLLHFRYSTKPYFSAEDVVRDLLIHFPSYTKGYGPWVKSVIEKIDRGIKHAGNLQQYNLKINNDNPSTNMHELVKDLSGFKSCG